MLSCPFHIDPITPHFYIVKLGFTGAYIFLIFALKHGLWILVRTTSLRRFERVPTSYVSSKNKKKNVQLKMVISTAVQISVYCIGML